MFYNAPNLWFPKGQTAALQCAVPCRPHWQPVVPPLNWPLGDSASAHAASCEPSPVGFPEMGIPQNRLFTMDNPIKVDDLGVITIIYGNPHMEVS